MARATPTVVPHDPECSVPTLRPRRVHASQVVHVTDTICAAAAHSLWGATEAVQAPALIVVRRGVFAIRGPRGSTIADGATALLMNGGEPYEVRHPVAGGDHCTALTFSAALVEQVLRAEGSAADAARRPGVTGPFVQPHRSLPIDALVRHGMLLRALAAGDTLAVDELALGVLGAVIRDGGPGAGRRRAGIAPRRPRTERRWIDAVEALRLRVAADPSTNESLTDLARHVHTSPYHLSRVFRWHTGMAIHEYRTRLRIAAALERLAGNPDVTTVALDLGFASHSHFTERFTALTGLTPSAYRAGRADGARSGGADHTSSSHACNSARN